MKTKELGNPVMGCPAFLFSGRLPWRGWITGRESDDRIRQNTHKLYDTFEKGTNSTFFPQYSDYQ